MSVRNLIVSNRSKKWLDIDVDDAGVNNLTIDGDVILSSGNSLNSIELDVLNAGAVSGFNLVNNLDGTINITSGDAYLRNSDNNDAPIILFDIAQTLNLPLVDQFLNIIYIDYDGGTPIVKVTLTADTVYNNENSLIDLYEVFRDGNDLAITPHFQVANNNDKRIQQFLHEKYGHTRTEGLILGETGTRRVTYNAGSIWIKLGKLAIPNFDTSVIDSFDRYYFDGVNWQKSSQTQWNNTMWNDIAVGLKTMTNLYFSYQEFYVVSPDKTVSLFGQAEYSALQNAEQAPLSSTVPPIISDDTTYIGRIVFQKSAGVASSIRSPFTSVFTTTPVTAHNALSDLFPNDDHPQYIFTNGGVGRAGGQQIVGGSDANDDLFFDTTSSATKGSYIFTDVTANTLPVFGASKDLKSGSIGANLTLVTDQLDTIQDIQTTSLPTFNSLSLSNKLACDLIEEFTPLNGVQIENISIIDDDMTGVDNLSFLDENDPNKINLTSQIHIGVQANDLQILLDDNTKDVCYVFGGKTRLCISEIGTDCNLNNPTGNLILDGGILGNDVDISNVNSITFQDENNENKMILKTGHEIGVVLDQMNFKTLSGGNGVKWEFDNTSHMELDETDGLLIDKIAELGSSGVQIEQLNINTGTISETTSTAIVIGTNSGGLEADLRLQRDNPGAGRAQILLANGGSTKGFMGLQTGNDDLEIKTTGTGSDIIMDAITSHRWKISSGADIMTLASTGLNITGALDTLDDITLTKSGTGTVTVDATATAQLTLDRGSSSWDSKINFSTAGVRNFFIQGASSTTNDFRIGSDLVGSFSFGIIDTDGSCYMPQAVNDDVSANKLLTYWDQTNGQIGYDASFRDSKLNIKAISDASWIYSVDPKEFNKKKKTVDENGVSSYSDTEYYDKLCYGMIAEEMELIKKDFVFYRKRITHVDGCTCRQEFYNTACTCNCTHQEEPAGIHYDMMIAPMIWCIKQLKSEVTTLKQRCDSLEAK